MTRTVALMLLLGGAMAALSVAFYLAGWSAGAQAAAVHAATLPTAPAAQVPPPLREIIPLPAPGDRQGQGQGQECEPVILFYHNGQLYQLQPGPGPQDRGGRPGSPPEVFPLIPYQGPAIPGLPFGPQAPRAIPQTPPFTPVNPRF